MFARDLHLLLAWVSVATLLAALLEAAYRLARRAPPGRAAGLALTASLVLLGMTAAGGVALLVSGRRPAEVLHFLYAVLAFAAVPAGDVTVASRSDRARALTRVGVTLIALVLVFRLFATG